MSSESTFMDESNDQPISGRVLVVDDEQTSRTLHRAILAREFDVETASSGEEALAVCRERLPDLVLLDIGMPGIDGFETCKKLRDWTGIPIIFVTSHTSLEEHLAAYDAGADDIVTKPVDDKILLRKAALAIRRYSAQVKLAEEKDNLQSMAMSFLSNMGESGTLLNFMRASIACRNYETLAQKLVDAAGQFGMQCSVLIRHGGQTTVLTSHGEPTELELSILEQSASLGRIFQFKSKLVVNYDRVSMIVTNMPHEDPEKDGRIRDNVTILAETAEALSENVDMRQESMARAEQMQIALAGAASVVETVKRKHGGMLLDSRILLQELIDSVEKTYSWLGTTPSQERGISDTMHNSVKRILELLATSDSEKEFNQVLEALRGGNAQNEVDLF